MSGAFSARGRIMFAFKANLITYVIMGLLFGAFLIYVALVGSVSFQDIPGFVVCVGNTWGLFLIVLLLGYGLVEIPRSLWLKSKRHVGLKHVQFKACGAHSSREEAREALSQSMDVIHKLSIDIPSSSSLRPYFEVIAAKVPTEEKISLSAVARRHLEKVPILEKIKAQSAAEVTEKDLVELHYYIKYMLITFSIAESEWKICLQESSRLESLIANMRSGRPPIGCLESMKWRLSVWYMPKIYKGLAIFCLGMSVLIMWIELTIFSGVDLSGIGYLMRMDNNWVVFITACISLAYFTAAGFYGIFNARLFWYYSLHPQHTGDDSLLKNASLVLRVVFALGYNFLFMLRIEGTAFQDVIGSMEVIPFFGNSFNNYFPILIVVVALLNASNIMTKITSFLGIRRFEFRENYQDDRIAEGKLLLRKGKADIGGNDDGMLL